MKTKLLMATLLMVIGVAQVRADEIASLRISHKDGSGIFVVNYRSALVSDLDVTIKDNAGNVLFTESVKHVKGFSLPVNLEDVGQGVYSVEVGNKMAKQVERLDYTNDQTPVTYAHATRVGHDRYMLSVAHAGSEKMKIRILNDAGDAVYEHEELMDGNFAFLYRFPNLVGTPSFEVIDQTGRDAVVK